MHFILTAKHVEIISLKHNNSTDDITLLIATVQLK